MSHKLDVVVSPAASETHTGANNNQPDTRAPLHVIQRASATPSKSICEVIDGMALAVIEDPTAAQASYQVDNHLVGATEVHVRAGSHRFVIDEPNDLGGTNLAPNPIEYALASLGSCQAITYRFWAEKLGIPFDRLSIEVDGDIDFRGLLGLSEDVRPGFESVRVTVRITGPSPRAEYERLHAEVERHCPMLDVFRNHVVASTRMQTS
ncbi:MAG TPA: OsmC family protein [Haliangium sp.]|nr:OsmC family protein [Haliangium sp.]